MKLFNAASTDRLKTVVRLEDGAEAEAPGEEVESNMANTFKIQRNASTSNLFDKQIGIDYALRAGFMTFPYPVDVASDKLGHGQAQAN
jgi:hypothetical protein